MISNLEKAFENFEFNAEQKGIQIGIEQGVEQGIEQGMKTGMLKVARTMLDKGMDMSDIIEITGLPRTEVEKLRKL